MSELTTEAGKRLIRMEPPPVGPNTIAAIEAEARAAILRELREEVERLSPMGRDDYLITAMYGTTRRPQTPADWVESYRAAVLAAIDRGLEP